MEIKKFGVVGAGQMGNGIAQVAAQAGLDVVMHDIAEEFVAKGLAVIKKNLKRSVDKGKMEQTEMDAVLGRITTVTELAALKDVDIVVEAATENEKIKLDIFSQLDEICPEGAILASNTSSISITKIAAATKRPGQMIGMHFMNPVPVMKLVEVIKGLATTDETFETVVELSKKLGKIPCEANDFPGFIANRILLPMINEAVYCLFEGVGQPEDIDNVMKLGMNHPMGPLALADLIGLDTCLAIIMFSMRAWAIPSIVPVRC
jgi:3-hydroxybutyryl-CoA dehydrogenase